MNKKTTLEDIGRLLDKFLIDEKAEYLEYWDPSKQDNIKSAKKDSSNLSMSWIGKIIDKNDPLKPNFFDDPS